MKVCRGNGGLAVVILNLSTKCRWVVGVTPLPLYPQGRIPQYLLNKRLDVSYNDPQHCTEKKNHLSLLGFEPIIIQPIVCSVYWLCCPSSKMCQNVNVYVVSVMAFWGPVPLSLVFLLLCYHHTSVSLLSASSLIKLLIGLISHDVFSLHLLLLILYFLLVASLANLPYRYLTIPYVPHFYPQEKDFVLLRFVFYFYLLYWLMFIFQNWKFTIGIGLVTLSWRWRQKEPETMTVCPMVPLPKNKINISIKCCLRSDMEYIYFYSW